MARWLVSWLLFLTGHLLSLPATRWECCAWLYRPYGLLMIWSSAVQGPGPHGPWSEPGEYWDA